MRDEHGLVNTEPETTSEWQTHKQKTMQAKTIHTQAIAAQGFENLPRCQGPGWNGLRLKK